MARRTPVLKVSNLCKAFGPVVIVEGFSLEVAAGEAIALTGRNGAGKSTVLRCLVGADRPDDGLVEVNGNTVTSGAMTLALLPSSATSSLTTKPPPTE